MTLANHSRTSKTDTILMNKQVHEASTHVITEIYGFIYEAR